MIELKLNKLVASFPELSLQPQVSIDFQRTLRIPDDGRNYPLPPGLGQFPLRHIDDYGAKVPAEWLNRGGVVLPMWQSEALWLNFQSPLLRDRGSTYHFAIKVATGKINAVTGESWQSGLSRNPQNYLVAPTQPWLDGYCVERGVIRQFVAMPLGEGYSVEEQLSGKAEFGGIQLEIFPMKAESFEQRFPAVRRLHESLSMHVPSHKLAGAVPGSMGLAPGGRMRQEIHRDPFSIHDWDEGHSSRCFIHLVNSKTWQAITGELPPTRPWKAEDYTRAGYPWFDFYNTELQVLGGSATLAGVKSVKNKAEDKGFGPLPDNQSVPVTNIVNLRAGLRQHQVRESDFS
jgi:hypothetical protein